MDNGEWDLVYVNSDGSIVSAYKSEWDAPGFLRHRVHGFLMPLTFEH